MGLGCLLKTSTFYVIGPCAVIKQELHSLIRLAEDCVLCLSQCNASLFNGGGVHVELAFPFRLHL